MFAVEKDVPLTSRMHRGRMPSTDLKFPWDEMEVGDSFFVPVGDADPLRLMNKITGSGNGAFGAGHIKARTVFESELGIRVWRVN